MASEREWGRLEEDFVRETLRRCGHGRDARPVNTGGAHPRRPWLANHRASGVRACARPGADANAGQLQCRSRHLGVEHGQPHAGGDAHGRCELKKDAQAIKEEATDLEAMLELARETALAPVRRGWRPGLEEDGWAQWVPRKYNAAADAVYN